MHDEVLAPHLKAYLDKVESFKVIDKYTFEIVWSEKQFTSLATSLSISPLPRHIFFHAMMGSEIPQEHIGSTFNKHWFDEEKQLIGVVLIGLVEYTPDRRVVFERNPAYWGKAEHFDGFYWDAEVKTPDPHVH